MRASPACQTGCAESPTDLGRLCDGSITETAVLQRAGGAELGARPLQALWHAHQERLAVGHCIVELLERNIERGQGPFLDGPVLEAMQRLAKNTVCLRLHLVEFFGGIALPRPRKHVQQAVAQRTVDVALVLLQIAREPRAQ